MSFTEQLLDGIRWRPGIGDPSFGGWLTVVAYVAAGLLCWHRSRSDVYRRAWLLLAVLLLLLAVNKQLDIQSLFTDIGRVIARTQGWYAERRAVQKGFVLAAGAVTLTSMALVAYLSWKYPVGSLRLAFVGLCFLGGFILVRSASFHHFDRFIDYRVAGLRMNWVLELGGIGTLALAALLWPERTKAVSS